MKAATALRLGAAIAALTALGVGCAPDARATAESMRGEIARLEQERDRLRQRLDELVGKDPRLAGMPQTPVRVAVPTRLLRELVEKLVAGFVDQVTLELRDLKLETSGSVRKLVTIGTYDLKVEIESVSGRLTTSKPEVGFGGNRVTLALPVTVASGSGRAKVHFKWDGWNVADAACGDLDVEQVVTGSVKPHRYAVRATLLLTATREQIVATPRFPPLTIKLEIDPSPESWAAVQRILDSKRNGVCGFVLSRVDVLGIVRGIVEKGFEVRLPTEKVKPLAVPVGIAPSVSVRGRTVALGIKVGGLALTPHALWLGAELSLLPPRE